MLKMFLPTVDSISMRINSYNYLLDARRESEYFSRKGELGFVNTIQATLNFNNHSQQLELDNYFELADSDKYVSQQAYSEARQKIKPEAFKQLFDITVAKAAANEDLALFKGYIPMAFDGSTLALDNLTELKSHFGCSGSKSNACTARVSIACDTLNGIIYDAVIEPYSTGERELAMRHIERLKALNVSKCLCIFDRGYVSDALLTALEHNGLKYIMRVREGWHAKLTESTPSGEWGTFQYNGKAYMVRIIKILLDSGEQEILFTNVSEFNQDEFQALYFLRWPVETKYDVIKNKLMLENFTGKTAVTIQQDFWAVMTLANLTAFAKLEADEMIAAADCGKKLKHNKQANTNALIGKLKDKLTNDFRSLNFAAPRCIRINNPTLATFSPVIVFYGKSYNIIYLTNNNIIIKPSSSVLAESEMFQHKRIYINTAKLSVRNIQINFLSQSSLGFDSVMITD